MRHVDCSYPEVNSLRFPPVASRDFSLVNRFDGKELPMLGITETTAEPMLARESQINNQFALMAHPMPLARPDAFPDSKMFIQAQQQQLTGGVAVRFPELDAALLGNYEGFRLMDDLGSAYYFTRTLRLRVNPETRTYEGRLHKTIFTTTYANSIDGLVRVIGIKRRASLKQDEANKEAAYVVLRVALHAYSIFNQQRFLEQSPAAGANFDASRHSYFLACFEKRDLMFRPDFDKHCPVAQLADYKTVDMPAFAQKASFAEFLFCCLLVVRAYATTVLGMHDIYSEEAARKLCEKDLHEHWWIIMTKMRIRCAVTPGIDKKFADLAEQCLVTKPDKVRLQFKEVQEISKPGKNSFGVVNKHRLNQKGQTKTPIYALAAQQLNRINWPVFLGHHSLLTWPLLDPARCEFDTRQAAFADDYKDPGAFKDAVYVWQYNLCAGRLSNQKARDDELMPEACNPINLSHTIYTLFMSSTNRLCASPPLTVKHSHLCNNPSSYTSPLSIDMAAWRWLLSRAAAIGDEEQCRRFLRYRDNEEMPALHAELFNDDALPEKSLSLEWHLQLARDTRFDKLAAPIPTIPKLHYEGIASSITVPGSAETQPLVQHLFDPDLVTAAALFRHEFPEYKGPDWILSCLKSYKYFLQGRVKYREEVPAIFHWLSLENGGKQPDEKVARQLLFKLQWGELLWTKMCRRQAVNALNSKTAPGVPEVRQDLARRYVGCMVTDTLDSLIQHSFFKHAPGGEACIALFLRRGEFWEALVERLGVSPKHAKAVAACACNPGEAVVEKIATKINTGALVPLGSVVCPNQVGQAVQSVDVKEAAQFVREWAVRHVLLPIVAYAALRFPSPDNVSYTGPDAKMPVFETWGGLQTCVDAGAELRKLGLTAAKISAGGGGGCNTALIDPKVPAVQRADMGCQQVISQINNADPEVFAREAKQLSQLPANGYVPNTGVLHLLMEVLPADNPMVPALQKQLSQQLVVNSLRASLAQELHSPLRKTPELSRVPFLTPESLLQCLNALKLIYYTETGNKALLDRLIFVVDPVLADNDHLANTLKSLKGRTDCQDISLALTELYNSRLHKFQVDHGRVVMAHTAPAPAPAPKPLPAPAPVAAATPVLPDLDDMAAVLNNAQNMDTTSTEAEERRKMEAEARRKKLDRTNMNLM